jgi:hypothetical protein
MKCVDCPYLNKTRMPKGWKPRAKCCLDEIGSRMRPDGSTFKPGN